MRDLQDGFKRFFKGQNVHPTYAKRLGGDSFRFPDARQFTLGPSSIELPKFGHIDWTRHREIEGRPKSVTVSREGNWWFSSVLCEAEAECPEAGTAAYGEPVGIDLGVAVPIMLSTGWDVPIARTPARETRRQRNFHKQLSRQKRGSANRRIRALAACQAR